MTDPEKMEALKRAYAEMILNTAKEGAARVMASDLKSWKLEQDLMSSKAEAARMLLRLKLMIDAKMKEADLTLLNQQRKVDELESQLNEAEGIIVDLRAELNQVQEHLKEANGKSLNPVRQNESASNNIPCSDTDNLMKSLDSIGNLSVLIENIPQEKHEAVRRSNRKRKLKHWDEVIDACSNPFKKVRQAISSLSCCKKKVKGNKVEGSVESDDQLNVEVKTQFGKRINCVAKCPERDAENLHEDSKLNVSVKQDETDAMVGIQSSSKIDFGVKCATSTESI